MDKIKCSELFRALEGKTIAKIDGESEYSLINEIEFTDGSRIKLGGSSDGSAAFADEYVIDGVTYETTTG